VAGTRQIFSANKTDSSCMSTPAMKVEISGAPFQKFQKLIFDQMIRLKHRLKRNWRFFIGGETRISSAFWTIDGLSAECYAKRVATMSNVFGLGYSKSLSMGDAAVLILNSAGHDLLRLPSSCADLCPIRRMACS
jgi:hypothetical protein